ncbi:hypothetical protein N0V90_008035 [Kalmusia sp. IMI 367209]|nr:hypothetical protein N0V90_008035 [Kalmusia sp. IMI 367209]
MFLVLLSSVLLIILPIIIVQYQRFLASLSAPRIHPPNYRTPSKRCHSEADGGYDGASSDTASEGLSNLRPERTVTTTGYGRKESRKPWDPPFPMRARTVRDPYLILPGSRGEEYNTTSEEGKGKGKEWERRSTSQIPPGEEEGESLAHVGHLPVTEPPLDPRSVSPTHRSQTTERNPQDILQQAPKAQAVPYQSAPAPAPNAKDRQGCLSIVQIVVLILSCIIFIFAFAILVAHCLAWFVVYKTEARLGEVKRGLLRGGDMRVCLCAR